MDTGLSAQPVGAEDVVVSTTLAPQQFYRHDPLLVLLKDILRLKNYLILAVVVVFTGGVLLGLAALDGTSFGLSGIPLGNLIRALLQTFVIFPVLALVGLVLPGAIAKLFNKLHAEGIIGPYRQNRPGFETYKDFLQKLVSYVDSGWWVMAALFFVVLYWLYRLLVIEPQPQLVNHSSLWMRIAILILYSFVLYTAFLTVVRLLVALIFTNWLFHLFTIRVNPLNLDRAAGFRGLGTMLEISGGLLVTMGVAGLVMNSSFLLGYTNPFSITEAIVLLITYVILTPVLLLGWLLSPHGVLVEARNKVLEPLAAEFQQALVPVSDSPEAETDSNAIETDVYRLARITRRYKLLDETFPRWPVEVGQVRRLTALVSLPALLPFLLPFLKNAVAVLGPAFGIH